MLFILLQFHLPLHLQDLSVHPGPDEALLSDLVKDILVLPFPSFDQRSQNLNFAALGEGHD